MILPLIIALASVAISIASMSPCELGWSMPKGQATVMIVF